MGITATIAHLLVRIGVDSSGLTGGLAAADAKVKGFAGTMGAVSSGMMTAGLGLTAGLTVPIIAGFGSMSQAAMSFERDMRAIQTIGKQSDSDLATLADTFLTMSTDIGKTTDSAEGLAEAYYFLQGSGFQGADAMMVLEAATKAGSAGLTDTATVAQALVFALNAYGLSADNAMRVSDIMFRTVDRGVLTFSELAQQFGDITATGALAGVPLEELGAAVSTLTKAGIQAPEAMTGLNQIMMAFIRPGKTAKETAAELGIELSATSLGSKGLYKSMLDLVEATGMSARKLGDISDAVGESDDAFLDAAEAAGLNAERMGKLFPNVRAFRAAVSLTRGEMGPFTEDMNAMAAAAGSTEAAYAIMTRSYALQMQSLQNTMGTLKIMVGNEVMPIMNDLLVNVIKPLVQGFMNLPKPVKEIIIKGLMLLAVLGPILLIGGALIKALLLMKGAFLLVLGVLSGAAGPIFLIIAVIGLLVLAWMQNWGDIQGIVKRAIGSIGQGLSNLISSLSDTWGRIKSGVSGFIGWMRDAGSNLIKAFAEGIRAAIGWVTGAIDWVLGALRGRLPGSDAKQGPLSDLMASGRALPETFAKGILSGRSTLEAASRAMARIPGSGPAFAGASAGASGIGGVGASSTVNNSQPISIVINNPRQEASSLSTMRALKNLSALGILLPAGA